MDNKIVSINPELCIGCGICVDICTRSTIEMGEESARIKDPARCFLCGHCQSICPENAIILHPLNAAEFEPVPAKNKMPDPETLMAFFRSRRSIRFFKKDPVEPRDLEKIIQSGRFIPTGGNRQPNHFVVLHSPEMIETIRRQTFDFLAEEAGKTLETMERHRKFGEPLPPRFEVRLGYAPLWRAMGKVYEKGKDLLFFYAPAVMVIHLDPEKASPFGTDAGLAAMQMVLMAEALGLGTCFSGFLTSALNSSPDLKQGLQIPAEHNVLLSFVVGHPDIQFPRLVSRNPAKVTYL